MSPFFRSRRFKRDVRVSQTEGNAVSRWQTVAVLSAASPKVVIIAPTFEAPATVRLQRVLGHEGFGVSVVMHGNEKHITAFSLHTILIFTEPSVVGAMRRIRLARVHHKAVPIIALGNDESDREIEYLLQAGANEYAKPPFATPEFALRLRTQHHKLLSAPHVDAARRIALDEIAMMVSVRGRAVALTAVESAILARLMREPVTIVSAQALSDDLRPRIAIGTLGALRRHINDLRKKIEANASRPTCIISVRRQGYMFQEDP